MHIPDGFLTNRIALSLDVVSGAGILYAARRAKVDISGRTAPIMGMLAAFVFAAQMLNFPVLGGTSGHLIGGSLLAVLLGPLTGTLTMASVVIAQALFLQDGGLVALGANVFNISAVTCFSGYAVFRIFGKGTVEGKHLFLAGFLAGWCSVMVSSACCAFELGLSGAIPLHIGLPAMLSYHAIVGIVEGMLTGGVLKFLLKVRPDLMKGEGIAGFGIPDWIGAVLFVAIPAALLIVAGSSSLPDPLQKLLGANAIASGAVPTNPLSNSRIGDYLIRSAAFILLVGLGILASHLIRSRRNRS
jgi:cobalt/nickel transport system permease protein